MPTRRALVVAGLVTTLASSASAARAEDDPPGAAQALFSNGRSLRRRGDCEGAIAVFREVQQLYPGGLGSLRNIAECEEVLGRYVSARRSWMDLKRALTTNASPRYQEWSQDADGAVTRLAPLVARLTINVAMASPIESPQGFRVTLDGAPVDPRLIGTPIETDPGSNVARLSSAGGQVIDERVTTLLPGTDAAITLRMPAVVIPQIVSVGRSSSVLAADSPESTLSTARVFGWLAVGIGSASLAGAAVSLGVYEQARDELNNGCPKYRSSACDPSLRSVVSEGHTAGTLFDGLAVTGIAAVTTGVVLLALHPFHDSAMGVVVSPAGVSATGRF
jgi:hypothetical protein